MQRQTCKEIDTQGSSRTCGRATTARRDGALSAATVGGSTGECSAGLDTATRTNNAAALQVDQGGRE
ncbi:hypothetical protein Scep_013996 [Stephania cephalantha]|uniref:Uncharacterized protein n=1 Tax=Stephania cephalantha TaxID=152367 RepID=A0AAP0J173_9MAGN